MGKFFKKTTASFLFLGILLIPFSYHLFPIHSQWVNCLFADLSADIFMSYLGVILKNSEITSDSATMFVLILIILIVSLAMGFLPNILKKWKVNSQQVYGLLRIIFTYFLALILLKYGFQKLFKWQFYLPEPNILYTPFGKLDPDILFWSTMGLSRSYCIFMGLLELIPAILMLFRKTRVAAYLIALPVLINIVAINFCFDISVKIFSLFLLFMNLFLLLPYVKSLFRFLILNKRTPLPAAFIFLQKHSIAKVILKTFIIGLILLEAIIPYLTTMNFNDDLTARPYLHGAYEVQDIAKNGQPFSLDSFPVKRLFIHRDGYLIFQNHQEEMQDFKLIINRQKQQLVLTDYDLKIQKIDFVFNPKGSILQLKYPFNNQVFEIKMKQLNWQELPALQNKWHWQIESVR